MRPRCHPLRHGRAVGKSEARGAAPPKASPRFPPAATLRAAPRCRQPATCAATKRCLNCHESCLTRIITGASGRTSSPSSAASACLDIQLRRRRDAEVRVCKRVAVPFPPPSLQAGTQAAGGVAAYLGGLQGGAALPSHPDRHGSVKLKPLRIRPRSSCRVVAVRFFWLAWAVLALAGDDPSDCALPPIPGLQLKVASKPQAVPVAMAIGSSANLNYIYIAPTGGW